MKKKTLIALLFLPSVSSFSFAFFRCSHLDFFSTKLFFYLLPRSNSVRRWNFTVSSGKKKHSGEKSFFKYFPPRIGGGAGVSWRFVPPMKVLLQCWNIFNRKLDKSLGQVPNPNISNPFYRTKSEAGMVVVAVVVFGRKNRPEKK